MLDHHAFRPAGRARSVDDVGEVLPRHCRVGVPRAPRGDGRPVGVEADGLAVIPGQQREQPFPRQQYGGPGVRKHEAEPLRRVARVEREVSAPGLEDAEDAGDHLGRALDAEPDQRVGADAPLAQVVGQLVRPLVQLPVSELPLAEGERHRFGGALGLRLEQLRQARLDRVFDRRLIPAHQQPLHLLLAEQRVGAVRLVQALHHQLVGAHVVVRDALDHSAVEYALVGEQGHGQVVPVESTGDVDVEVEVRLPEA